ncbi:putative small heat shock protein [Triangularia verruculosa]|uniref:Small heat shock protein n=1 Tax=Triangularia verruculosa TaxID=2587418 RepID=A0AAN7ASJ3_9PEZI|nr:putative small heat shock protein [Triangularia verruculosa]
MSMFFAPAFCAPEEPNFMPLFRFLDEWEQTQQQQPERKQQQQQQHPKKQQPQVLQKQQQQPQLQKKALPQPQPKRFQPAFDVREVEDAYELYADLPGVAKENVSIEFPEPQTITISGKVERNYDQLFAPSQESISENPEEQPRPRSPYQATVEDDTEDEEYDAVTPVTSRPATPTSAEIVKQPAQQQTQQTSAPVKYWLQERNFGEFSRTFQFPGRVNTDEVTAALENGILRIRVPKAKAYERRRITVF